MRPKSYTAAKKETASCNNNKIYQVHNISFHCICLNPSKKSLKHIQIYILFTYRTFLPEAACEINSKILHN